MKVAVTLGERRLVVDISTAGGAAMVDGDPVAADVVEVRPGVLSVLMGGRSLEITLEAAEVVAPGVVTQALAVDGRSAEVTVEDERRRSLMRSAQAQGSAAGSGGRVALVSPMPGRVVAVPAQVGQQVERGAPLVVLEAMKMESALGAPHAGTVTEVLVSPGQTVQQREALVRIERTG